MSILHRAKRRFLVVCLVTFVILMTVSWHLLRQSYETTIIKTSQLKTVIERPGLIISRLQTNKSDLSFTSRYGRQYPTNNTSHGTIIPNEFKNILMKMTDMLKNSNHQISKEEGKYLDILKKQLSKIPNDYKMTENTNVDEKLQQINKLDLSFNIPQKILRNKTSSVSQLTIRNTAVDKSPRVKSSSENVIFDQPTTAPNLQFHPSESISNHENVHNSIKQRGSNDSPPANNFNNKLDNNNQAYHQQSSNYKNHDNNNHAPVNHDTNDRNHVQIQGTDVFNTGIENQKQIHDKQLNNNNADVQHATYTNHQIFINSNKTNDQHVKKLTDISMTDLQNTWNKMKKQNTKYETLKSQMIIPQSVSNMIPPYEDDEDVDDEQGATYRPEYCKGCFSYDFQPIIQQSELCKSKNRIRLLMFISSAPNNRESRVVIRKTWAAKCRDPNSDLKCVFVLGRAKNSSVNMNLITENKTYGDILQIDFLDSYSNLTYKTMSSFKWAAKYCSNARYVMKTDDDMYVNTELVTQMLQAAPTWKFVGGYCWGTSRPNRDFSSKWFVSYRMFQKPRFPPMCSGTGYILSMDVIRRILMASHNVPFFHLEDVYVSLCLQKFGIMPNNLLGFSNVYTEFDPCLYKNSVMTSHQIPSQILEDFWPSIQDCPAKNVAPLDLYIVLPYPVVE